MVGLLNATLLKPISRILEERDRRTKGRIGEAERVLLSVEQKLVIYERRLREARGNGYTLLEKERGAAAQEGQRKIGDAKAEMVRLRDGETERLRREESAARESLMSLARERAAEIGARILGRRTTARE
jgi:F-type H+-transporting ATPase subunit b